MFASQQALFEEGISCDFEIMAENCHVDDSRNILVRDFLETDCDMLVFLDADLRWNPSELVRLIKHEGDIVGGTYPLKNDKDNGENYPVRLKEGDIVSIDGLIEVEALPTGFLKISRHVLEHLYDISPGFYGKLDTSERKKIPVVFERTMHSGARWGGDYTFCRKAGDLGYKLYLDPEMTFEHHGGFNWVGSYADYIRERNGIDNPVLINALNKLQNGETEDVFAEIFKGWGNQWAASPELLMTCYEMALQEKGNVLECGSGISTLVMGMTGIEVYSLESDYLWYHKLKKYVDKYSLTNVHLIYSKIRDYGDYSWYDINDLPTIDFNLALVDGPSRIIGREGFYELFPIDSMKLIIDDANSEPAPEGRINHVFCERRPFAISLPLKRAA